MNMFDNTVLQIPVLKTSSLGNVKTFVDANHCTSLIRWEQVEYISGVYQEKILEQVVANERLKKLESENKPVQMMEVDQANQDFYDVQDVLYSIIDRVDGNAYEQRHNEVVEQVQMQLAADLR